MLPRGAGHPILQWLSWVLVLHPCPSQKLFSEFSSKSLFCVMDETQAFKFYIQSPCFSPSTPILSHYLGLKTQKMNKQKQPWHLHTVNRVINIQCKVKINGFPLQHSLPNPTHETQQALYQQVLFFLIIPIMSCMLTLFPFYF